MILLKHGQKWDQHLSETNSTSLTICSCDVTGVILQNRNNLHSVRLCLCGNMSWLTLTEAAQGIAINLGLFADCDCECLCIIMCKRLCGGGGFKQSMKCMLIYSYTDVFMLPYIQTFQTLPPQFWTWLKFFCISYFPTFLSNRAIVRKCDVTRRHKHRASPLSVRIVVSCFDHKSNWIKLITRPANYYTCVQCVLWCLIAPIATSLWPHIWTLSEERHGCTAVLTQSLLWLGSVNRFQGQTWIQTDDDCLRGNTLIIMDSMNTFHKQKHYQRLNSFVKLHFLFMQ